HHPTNLSRRSPTKADPSIHQSTNPPPLQLRTRWTRFSLSSGERAGVRASFPLSPFPPPLHRSNRAICRSNHLPLLWRRGGLSMPHHHSNHRWTNNPSSIIPHPSSVPRHHPTNLSRR